MFRTPTSEGEPWKRVLRRANSEAEARKIFVQAEAALDTEQTPPVGADLRASRTIRMLGEQFVQDSVARGKHPPTIEPAESSATRAGACSTCTREPRPRRRSSRPNSSTG